MAAAGPDHGHAAASPTEASSLTSAPAAAGSRCGWRNRVGPNGTRLRRGRPAADDRGRSRGARAARGCQQRQDRPRDAVGSPAARTGSSTPCCSSTRITRSSIRSSLLRNVARSLKPDGRIGIVEFKKDGRARTADGRARRSRAGDPRRRGRRPAAAVARDISSAINTCSCSAARDSDAAMIASRILRGLSAARRRRAAAAVAGRRDRVRRSDGLHAPRPVEARPAGADAADRGAVRRHRGRGADRRVRDRNGARLLAHPRRPAVHGRCGAAAGKPANHVAFGEAIAILAAFGLLNLALRTLARELRAGAGAPVDRAALAMPSGPMA